MLNSNHDDGSGRLPRYPSDETAPEATSREDGRHSYDMYHTYDTALMNVRLIRRELLRLSAEGVVLCKVLGQDHGPQLHLDAIAQLDVMEDQLQIDAAIRPNIVID